MNLRDFEAECWRLYCEAIRGALLIVSSLLLLASLVIYFPLQYLIDGLRYAGHEIQRWSPTKPAAFGE
jgi:hypothetical protein